jgi:hypothetical protein
MTAGSTRATAAADALGLDYDVTRRPGSDR